MELYLVQHGLAESSESDPNRPLTRPGREEVTRIGRALANARVAVDVIYHSGKLRAAQTANTLGELVGAADGILQLAGLNPNDDPAIAESQLRDLPERVMLVGHLPHLSRLTSLLLFGDAAREVVAYRNAGVVCLRAEAGGRWVVRWYLVPELIVRS